jgi:hypothetical protein
METVMDETVKQDVEKISMEDKNIMEDISDDIYELAVHISKVAFLLSDYFFHSNHERMESGLYDS